jgi:hypothetical protein
MTDIDLYRRFTLVVAAIALLGSAAAVAVARHGGRPTPDNACPAAAIHCAQPFSATRIAVGA